MRRNGGVVVDDFAILAQILVGGGGRGSLGLLGGRFGVGLNLGLEVGSSGLGANGSFLSVLSGELLGGLDLGVDHVGNALDLLIDQLLIVDVDERRSEGSNGS